MKNKLLKSFIVLGAMVVAFSSCSDDDTLPVKFDELTVSGGPYASEITTNGSTNVNKLDPSSSSFSKDYQLISPAGGTDISKVEVYVSLVGQNINADEALLLTADASSFTSPADGGYPEANIVFDGAAIITALGIDSSNLEGGDTFNYRLAITNPGGTFSDVSANFDNQSADHTFSSTVVCIAPPPPGVWTIDMHDSYGDGWQTVGNSSAPITITLNDGTVFQVGLCTPYEANNFACINEANDGTDTITIPTGTTSADWFFPGDNYGEISFEIYAPSGNLVAAYTGGSAAGPIALNLCNE
ncbi:hypothetical protein IMCC3317_18890 [Kordia antarctica]|uniref:DUF1735 domain-containing protein n=1 Tax=Kordia antarctica TaxID=1218801 RepID=A0A7L4ZJY8_9FLAO|nr:hypothetical protein [Kordia antarctica]QHI36526.1 hypothetical protein IMCC3317_18890 [Kordia antarctica]